MSQTNYLTQEQKTAISTEAAGHLANLRSKYGAEISTLTESINADDAEVKRLMREFDPHDIEIKDLMKALRDRIRNNKIRRQITQDLISAPYFVRLDMTRVGETADETIRIGKFPDLNEKIYSWLAPIATLRYAEMGEAEYVTPHGEGRKVDINRRDTFVITEKDIVFHAFQTKEYDRQVISQKHFDERRNFLLPEIVAELDRLQDQIIRSNPAGSFLISGPAGSGKTTLALHRIAYLVLTPEFRGYFDPERILVFVADQGAINYFSNLLPELGINGVKITTFNDWSLMIANSRFRAPSITQRFHFTNNREAIEFIREHNPIPELHPRLVLDEYRKLKQEVIMRINIKEGKKKDVYPTLHKYYRDNVGSDNEALVEGFLQYLKFQEKNSWLDEVDLIILLNSLSEPVRSFAHIVIDEVQNWLPEQLQFVKGIADKRYSSISFIGDIRQKTKAFTIQDWSEIDENFSADGSHKVELLKVYRNTKPILQYLKNLGYDIEVAEGARLGADVVEIELEQSKLETKVKEIIVENPDVQIGVIAKYQDSLDGLENLGYDNENVHVLTIEEAQGLEFNTVIILDAKDMAIEEASYIEKVGYTSGQEYFEQAKHLMYVAITRAQEKLYVIK